MCVEAEREGQDIDNMFTELTEKIDLNSINNLIKLKNEEQKNNSGS